MESFDQLAKQYEPMIHKIIHSLHIYKNVEEYYQVGLIGLWDAKECFDAEKGKFSTYAYSYIKGRILNELTRVSKQEERVVYPKEEYWEMIEEPNPEHPFEVEFLLSYCQDLTPKETKWVLASCLTDMSIKDIADKEHVSISAVKQWRSGAKRKLRGLLEIID
jgi:DNA-directed RNA polymerase